MIKKVFRALKKIYLILNRKQKISFCFILVGSVIAALLETLGVTIIIPVIDVMLQPQKLFGNEIVAPIIKIFHIDSSEKLVVMVILGVIVLYLVKNGYSAWFSLKKIKYSCRIQRELSMYMLESYMNRGYQFFLSKNTNFITTGVQSDVYNVYHIINCLMYIISKGLIVVFIGIYLISVDWQIALAVIGIALFCLFLIVGVFRKQMKVAGILDREYYRKANQILLQIIQGIKDILILRKQRVMVSQFDEYLGKSQKQQIKRQIGQDYPTYLIEFFFVSVIMIVLFFRVSSGEVANNVEFVATLAAFAIGAFRIMPSLSSISSAINSINTYIASLESVYENVIEARKYNKSFFKVEVKDNEAYRNKEFLNQIELKDICFSYGEEFGYVLNGININIDKGSSIGIMGVSGAGKSTLADIILGVMEPSSGQLCVDGVSIYEIPNRWSELVGFVPQTIYLSDMSVRENIAFAVPENEIDDNKVRDALDRASILDFVEGLPNGIYTEIGERGVRLSGGQRQRLGIARALYRCPEILVLDEATSALDNETETSVMGAIDNLQGKVTLIVIAHRLSTIRNCDFIYEICNGKAVERKFDEISR